MKSAFERELREQPLALARQLAERPRVEAVAAAIRTFQPHFASVVGRGSSGNAARFARYLFEVRHGLAVSHAGPSVVTRYQSPPSLRGALVIGISQSGQSPDIVAVLDAARGQGALSLAITNDPDSPLAKAASLCLPLQAGEERAVAATKTYTNQLLALAMLSAALSSDEQAWGELAAVPAHVDRALMPAEALQRAAESFRRDQRLVVVGRGFHYATAREVALKIKEMAYVMAEAYSPAELLHGPIAMVDQDLPLLAVATRGRVCQDVMAAVAVAQQRGSRTIAISDVEDVLTAAHVPLRVPADVPEWLSPLVAIVPGQQWALALTLARGGHPDTPRGLSKVTTTR